jgi:small subunit ribosomal protein S21
MAKIEVKKSDDFVEVLKKFGQTTSETRRVAKRHEYYLRPGLKAKFKIEEAKKVRAKSKHKNKKYSDLRAATHE